MKKTKDLRCVYCDSENTYSPAFETEGSVDTGDMKLTAYMKCDDCKKEFTATFKLLKLKNCNTGIFKLLKLEK